jgi:hypothetical protein
MNRDRTSMHQELYTNNIVAIPYLFASTIIGVDLRFFVG